MPSFWLRTAGPANFYLDFTNTVRTGDTRL
jgi:hypothetical protein